MKVVFLDYNYVLDTSVNIDEVDYLNLQRLKRIIKETGEKIVLTSSIKNSYCITGNCITGIYNRQFLKLKDRLISEGLEILDITKHLETRKLEVLDYLKTHNNIKNYCIIDDDYKMDSLKDHLVKLPNQMEEGQMGLDDYHTDMAIKILKRNDKVKKLK